MGFRSIAAVACAALNQFSSSTIRSSVSSSNLPPLGNANSRAGYNNESTLRTSTSLQDLTSYRKINVEEDDFAAASSADLLQAKPSVYHVQRDGAVYNSKVPKGCITRPRPRCYCKVLAVTALTCLFVILTYFGFQWWRLGWRPEKLHYAIVMDCGSTGTRVQVYAWAYNESSGPHQLPIVLHPTFHQNLGSFAGRKVGQKREARAYHRMETEPGLDKLLKNDSGVRAAVEPLLQWAEKQIPSTSHRKTPLFLLATAGLRRLTTSDAEWLLDKAWVILEKSPFMCRRSWVKVISGVEEAYYGWVALNYKFSRLGQIPRQSTFGALDLGGSSLQVTFESEEIDHSEYGLNLSVGSAEHHLYAYSHAGFGLNDAFDRSVGLLWGNVQNGNADLATRLEIHHPCLHMGFQTQYKCSHCLSQSSAKVTSGIGKGAKEDVHAEIVLIGQPDWEACRALADAVVRLNQGSDCLEAPCALGRHQPPPHGQFYALSGFFVVYKFFGLGSNDHFQELLNKGKSFCAKPWKEALDSVVPQPLVEHYCFRAPYVVGLLQDGLHLKEDQLTVGSGDMTWTLGAALLEAGAFFPTKSRSAAPRGSSLHNSEGLPPLLDTGSITVFLLVMMILVLFAVTFFLNFSLSWQKPHLPLFTQPSFSPAWFHTIFFSPIRHGSSKGDGATRNGDGRYKTYHSPAAALGMLQDPQLRFGSTLSGFGNPVLESTGSQLPAVGGSMCPLYATKMPHKGNSQLSSRRTSSRDDLNLYLRDSHVSKV